MFGGEKMSREQKRIILPLWNSDVGAAPVWAPVVTDPNGSYTGRPSDPEDKPVQDADDL